MNEDKVMRTQVVAAKLKQLGSSSYGYQKLIRSRHTKRKYLRDQHCAKSSKRLKIKSHEPPIVRSNTAESRC